MAGGGIQDILMGKPNALSYETQTDQSALQRKRRIVQQLLQNALQSGSPTVDAGAYKVANWAEPLGKIIQAIVGSMVGGDVDKEEAALARAQQERHSSAAAQFAKDAQGYTAEPQGPMPDGGAMPPQAVKGDLLKALMGAMQSGDPQMQGIASKGMEEGIFKKMLSEKDKLPNTQVVDGNLVTTDPMNGQITNRQPGVTYGPPQPASPTMPAGQVQQDTGKLTPMGTGQLATVEKDVAGEFGSVAIKDLLKRAGESYGKLTPALNRAPYIADAMGLLDKAVVGAPWSSLELSARKAAKALGWYKDEDERIPATDLLAPSLGHAALDIIKDLRPASDKDYQAAFELVGAGGTISSQASKELARRALEMLVKDTVNHEKTLKDMGGWEEQLPAYSSMIKQSKKQYELPSYSFQVPGGGADPRLPGPPSVPGGGMPMPAGPAQPRINLNKYRR